MSGMKSMHNASRIVTAPPDAVFDLLTEVNRLSEWNQIIRRVLEVPHEVVAGAQWVVEMHAMGQTWASRTTVEHVDLTGRRITYRSGTDDANPSFTRWSWRVDDHPAGSEVTVSWDLNPRTFWRRHLIVHLRRRALAREVPTSLDALETAAINALGNVEAAAGRSG